MNVYPKSAMSEATAALAPPGPPAPNMNIMPDIVPDMSYVVPEDAIRQFHEQGFCILRNFLSEAELQTIDEIYAKFLSGEIKPEGKDLCDMSDTTGKRTFDQYSPPTTSDNNTEYQFQTTRCAQVQHCERHAAHQVEDLQRRPVLPHPRSHASRYYPPLQNNVYERRAAGAVAQLYKGIPLRPKPRLPPQPFSKASP
jgi:hypothetical protein